MTSLTLWVAVSEFQLHSLRAQEQQFSLHIRMDRATKGMAPGPFEIEADCGVTFRIQHHAAEPPSVHNDPVFFDFRRDPLEHGGAEIMSLPVFVANRDDRRKPEAERPLLRDEGKVFDDDIHDLFGLRLGRQAWPQIKRAHSQKHQCENAETYGHELFL